MLYSRAHNVCVYKTEIPERILNLVPGALHIGGGQVGVPCSVPNMQIMRALGYEAMSPILTHYDFPIRPPLSPFVTQKATAAFITLHPRCFVLNDIGTGKTLSLLWALDFLMLHGLVKKALIMSPLSTLETVWFNEIGSNFLSRRKAVVLYGDREKRKRLLDQNADFYLINHDGLGIGTVSDKRGIVLGELATLIRDNPDINSVTVDEGSVYKDSGTTRYKVMRQVTSNTPYLQWITGGPTPNEPVDAWAQVRAVRKDYMESQKNFRDRTMYRLSQFKWVPKKSAPQTVSEILQPAIRFERSDVVDLPPLMTIDRAVELSDAQKKAYTQLKRELKATFNSGQVTAVNEAVLRNKLIQISCGAVYGEQHQIHKVDVAPRLAVLREVISEVREKILIFAPLTSVVKMLYDVLSPDFTVEVINGAVGPAKRSEVFRDFQSAQNPRIIVADPRTMAHGLTLTAASTIIWYGPTDQPEIYTQANGRINRPGQNKSMLVVRLSATNIEREIYRRLDNKQGLQGLMLDIIRGEDAEE